MTACFEWVVKDKPAAMAQTNIFPCYRCSKYLNVKVSGYAGTFIIVFVYWLSWLDIQLTQKRRVAFKDIGLLPLFAMA